jgi:hypothetical protein
MRLSDQPFASMIRHISGPVIDFKPPHPGFECSSPAPAPVPSELQYPGNGLVDVVLEFIHGFPLRIAAREGWNLCPKSAFRVFVDDNSVVLHGLIFS